MTNQLKSSDVEGLQRLLGTRSDVIEASLELRIGINAWFSGYLQSPAFAKETPDIKDEAFRLFLSMRDLLYSLRGYSANFTQY